MKVDIASLINRKGDAVKLGEVITEQGIKVEVIDLRIPHLLDSAAIIASVMKVNRIVAYGPAKAEVLN